MKRSLVNTVACSIVSLFLILTNAFEAHATGEVSSDLAPVRGFYVLPRGQFISVTIPASTEFIDIQRISLPQGKYIVNASAVVIVNNSPAPVDLQCVFMIDGLIVSEVALATLGGASPTEAASLPLTVGLRIREQNDLSLACRTGEQFPPTQVASQSSPISAIRVNRLILSECCESE